MEKRAPYRPEVPKGPRNLAPQVAAELRKLGFTAIERDHGTSATVEAHWQSPQGLRFYLDYRWSARQATVSLVLYYPDVREPMDLVKGQHVGHLREVRHLLHNDVRFRAERQRAKDEPIPTAS